MYVVLCTPHLYIVLLSRRYKDHEYIFQVSSSVYFITQPPNKLYSDHHRVDGLALVTNWFLSEHLGDDARMMMMI